MFYCVAGMNMNPVSRLKKTWNKVNTDKFDILVVRMREIYAVGSSSLMVSAHLMQSEFLHRVTHSRLV